MLALCFLLLAIISDGCTTAQAPAESFLPPTLASIVASFPHEFQGIAADIRIIDKAFLSGVDADDVLDALGLTREEAIVAVAEYGPSNATAIAVPGAALQLVMTTTAHTWRAISVAGRTETQVAGRRTIALVEDGRVYLVAQARGITYVVGSPSESVATQLLAALLTTSPAESR